MRPRSRLTTGASSPSSRAAPRSKLLRWPARRISSVSRWTRPSCSTLTVTRIEVVPNVRPRTSQRRLANEKPKFIVTFGSRLAVWPFFVGLEELVRARKGDEIGPVRRDLHRFVQQVSKAIGIGEGESVDVLPSGKPHASRLDVRGRERFSNPPCPRIAIPVAVECDQHTGDALVRKHRDVLLPELVGSEDGDDVANAVDPASQTVDHPFAQHDLPTAREGGSIPEHREVRSKAQVDVEVPFDPLACFSAVDSR